MDKITKLPWTYDKERCDIKDANGIILATMALGQHSAIEKMVRAVNSHEDLVTALKDACLLIKETMDKVIPDYKLSESPRFMALIESVKAADGEGVK